MQTKFEDDVIEIYNKAALSASPKVEYKASVRRDDLDNLYIDVEYSGILRNVQEQICEIYDRIDKEKILRATELLIRSLNYRNGPALTLPDEFEKQEIINKINDCYMRKPIKLITKIEIS